MAKEIVAWCDLHMLRDEAAREPGREVVVTLDGTERAIDLCDVCRKELIEPLAELLVEQGQPVSKRLTQESIEVDDGSFPCPVCAKPYKMRANWRKHLKREHDLLVSDLEADGAPSRAEADVEQPTADATLDVDIEPSAAREYPCPDCDRVFTRGAALGAHRRSHGYVSERYQQQRDEADAEAS
jgi:uncharacterized C2H2 Zn-finger protein